MKSALNWISEGKNRQGVPLDQICFLTDDVEENIVSIKGSNVYPITYSNLANVSLQK